MDEQKIRSRMDGAIAEFKAEISSIRTGRANGALVSDLEIEAYGGAQRLRIQELASITVPDPQTIQIEPWDKSIIGDIKKGIMAANIGLNPSIDSELIRINIPPMTGEDRERFVKLLNVKIENAKVMVRQIRSDGMKEIKKMEDENVISEDERRDQEKKLQDLTDEFVGKIDEMGESKKVELLQI